MNLVTVIQQLHKPMYAYLIGVGMYLAAHEGWIESNNSIVTRPQNVLKRQACDRLRTLGVANRIQDGVVDKG